MDPMGTKSQPKIFKQNHKKPQFPSCKSIWQSTTEFIWIDHHHLIAPRQQPTAVIFKAFKVVP